MPKRTREQIYPDTDTFIYYNANPKNRITGDCSVRAIATILDKPWREVVMEMAELGCENGYSPWSRENIDRYLKLNGWVKMKQPRKWDNTKYTGREFIEDIVREQYYDKPMVVSIGSHHITCIQNNHVYDIWDCTNEKVGNYWVKA